MTYRELRDLLTQLPAEDLDQEAKFSLFADDLDDTWTIEGAKELGPYEVPAFTKGWKMAGHVVLHPYTLDELKAYNRSMEPD